jgi:hypothetical protein
LATLLCES